MTTVLDGILARTRADVARRRRQQPRQLQDARRLAPTRGLRAAIARPGLRFILEVKQRSPSAGVLRADFDPVQVAHAYQPVADAISVLTDQPFFHGSFDHLRRVREAVRQPILCKDFIVDPFQVLEARVAGADAILLMLSVLDDAGFRECAALAARLDLDVLAEVHDEEELERALRLDAPAIGINNRNLRTMAVDLDTTRRLAPLVPADRVLVSESGYRSREDVDRVAPQVRAFLVGSALVGAPHVGRAARSLAHGAVKVCGLTREEDARAAYDGGATYGGLVFAPESPRRVTQERAAALVGAAPLAWCGVFVNQEAGAVAEIATALGLHAVQLHGDEDRRYLARLRRVLPESCEIWKAVAVRDAIPTPEAFGADRLLLDGYHPEQRGGTGRRFDWRLLAGVTDRSRFVLAGGLDAGNIRQAHNQGCGLLDVGSGVESSPGVKDVGRLQALFAALRSVP